MNEEVTATSASVSAFDPDRDMAQQQSGSSTRLPERQHRTGRMRPVTRMGFWSTFEQAHRLRRSAGLGSPKSGRDATTTGRDFSDYVPLNTSIGYSTVSDLRSEFDPWSEYIAELEEKGSDAQQVRQAYKARIDTLRSAAALDGIDVNEASERDFWSFIGSSRFSRRASLALMDNGNLRAVWKGEDASHLGLHFLGEQQIQYVIFKRRSGSRRVSRTAGIDTFGGVKKQIGAFDLMSLVNA